jgi:hypothetical protein
MKRKFWLTLGLFFTVAVVWLLAVAPAGTYNGQTIFTLTAPTASACGTSPTVNALANINGATITVGAAKTTTGGFGNPGPTTVPVTQCTVAFNVTFTDAPNIVAVAQRNGLNVYVLSVTTTGATFVFDSNAAGAKFSYLAF